MGTRSIIDGVVVEALSQAVTFDLSPEQEETRSGLVFWSVMCVALVVPGADDGLKWLVPGRQSADRKR